MEIPALNMDNLEDVEKFKKLLREFLSSNVVPDVRIDGYGNEFIYYLHRSLNDEEIYFFVNTSNKFCISVDIYMSTLGWPIVYDVEKGSLEPLRYYENKGTHLCLRYTFEPCSSLLLGIRKDSIQTKDPIMCHRRCIIDPGATKRN